MKIVYEPNEKQELADWYQTRCKDRAEIFNTSDPDRIYHISFKVTNVAIAHYILLSMLNDHLEDFDMGIDVQSIDIAEVVHVNDIKERLHRMIDEMKFD